jgi:RNase adaptor protein for sRNA GlmZ degradation
MDQSKLKSIITRQNESRERHALNEAESIIEEIARQQSSIATTQNRIAELRQRLSDLQVEQLDASTILGGE